MFVLDYNNHVIRNNLCSNSMFIMFKEKNTILFLYTGASLFLNFITHTHITPSRLVSYTIIYM